MSALTRYSFDTVYYPRSARSVVAWWETRRASSNLAVGATGLVTLGVVGVLGMLPPLHALPIAVASHAILANVCHTAGALADLLARRVGGAGWAPIGATLFRYGFVYSIGLTLLPIPIAVLGRVMMVPRGSL